MVAVLLAAGGGSRFDGASHKLLAPIGGRPLVARAVDAALVSTIGEVVVVEGAVDLSPVLPEGVVRVRNQHWHDGIATSLAAGLSYARRRGAGAVVVGLGDQPAVPPGAWRAVASCTATPVAVATYAGRRGHPVRLAAAIWDLLPTRGDEGARGLLRARPDLVTEVACAGDPVDVDTREDLRRWS